MLEVHKVKHHNQGEDSLDHSWVPFVNGKPLTNRNRPDGHFTSRLSAETAISKHVKKPLSDLTIRLVK